MSNANELINATIAYLGNERKYYEYSNSTKPFGGYATSQVIGQDIFFDWCKKCGFECSGNRVFVDTPGLKDINVVIGRYQYGPEVGLVVFSYD